VPPPSTTSALIIITAVTARAAQELADPNRLISD